MNTELWEHSGLKFEGLSLAGVRTCITLPQYSIAFDVAQGLPHATSMNTFFITHGHMDHAAGIPYLISQKAMNSHRPPHFIMPKRMIGPMTEIMRQWALIEGHGHNFEFIGMSPGEDYSLRPNLYVRSFPTVHRIPSQGYSIYRKYRKLKSSLSGISSEKIVNMRRKGPDPTEQMTELLVSFTGDTQIEFLDLAPEVCNSKILFLETTYLDEKKSISNAREWGHTHFDELIPRLNSIKSEKIVLIHTSARYSIEAARAALKKRLPTHESERVVLFTGR